MYTLFIKRSLDLILSVIGFVILIPLTIVIYLALLFIHGGKPLFRQLRPGKHEKNFYILKFKTMNDGKDSLGNLLPDEQRITKLGMFLRKTSLDEIPQLINIINGDMSLIGPRPLKVSYLPYYTRKESTRHTIRPGITGLAQISGRNLLQWDERLQKDVEYVENLSFALDCKILFRTLFKVVRSEGVALDSETGMIDLDEYRRGGQDLSSLTPE